jgi:hypothetical protein
MVWGVDLQPFTCWNCGFELCREHGCLSLVNVVCCQVEVSVSVTRSITLGEVGGGGNWPWVLGTLFLKGVKFERGKIGPIKRKFFILFFCRYSVNQKKLFLGWKNIERAFAPPPSIAAAQVTPMVVSATGRSLVQEAYWVFVCVHNNPLLQQWIDRKGKL